MRYMVGWLRGYLQKHFLTAQAIRRTASKQMTTMRPINQPLIAGSWRLKTHWQKLQYKKLHPPFNNNVIFRVRPMRKYLHSMSSPSRPNPYSPDIRTGRQWKQSPHWTRRGLEWSPVCRSSTEEMFIRSPMFDLAIILEMATPFAQYSNGLLYALMTWAI